MCQGHVTSKSAVERQCSLSLSLSPHPQPGFQVSFVACSQTKGVPELMGGSPVEFVLHSSLCHPSSTPKYVNCFDAFVTRPWEASESLARSRHYRIIEFVCFKHMIPTFHGSKELKIPSGLWHRRKGQPRLHHH